MLMFAEARGGNDPLMTESIQPGQDDNPLPASAPGELVPDEPPPESASEDD